MTIIQSPTAAWISASGSGTARGKISLAASLAVRTIAADRARKKRAGAPGQWFVLNFTPMAPARRTVAKWIVAEV
jgi:hypothetical protein